MKTSNLFKVKMFVFVMLILFSITNLVKSQNLIKSSAPVPPYYTTPFIENSGNLLFGSGNLLVGSGFVFPYTNYSNLHVKSQAGFPTRALFQTEVKANAFLGLASIQLCINDGSQNYGIYQTSDISAGLINYFQAPVKIGNAVYTTLANNSQGIIGDFQSFNFTLSKISGPQCNPLTIDTGGIYIPLKTRTNEFQLLTRPGYGKILTSDDYGNGFWSDSINFNDNHWLETHNVGKGIDPPPPNGKKSLYLNPDFLNVGIGTDDPKSMLHVVDGNILISPSPSKAPGSRNGSILFGEVITEHCPRGEWGIEYFTADQGYSSGGLNFWKVASDTSQGANYCMFIRNDGNIGIGTSDPQSKLAVNGKITALEVEVTLDGFPDYVLKPGYSLRSLDEVEKYITTHNHLPEIPSEAEVTEQGLNLGEMNSLLLKKVEELTLYIISMKKDIEELKAQQTNK